MIVGSVANCTSLDSVRRRIKEIASWVPPRVAQAASGQHPLPFARASRTSQVVRGDAVAAVEALIHAVHTRC